MQHFTGRFRQTGCPVFRCLDIRVEDSPGVLFSLSDPDPDLVDRGVHVRPGLDADPGRKVVTADHRRDHG